MFTKNSILLRSLTILGASTDSIWDSLIAWNGNALSLKNDYSYFVASRNIYNYMASHIKKSQSEIPSDGYNSSFSSYGVCFGNGKTPATENDYCMEGDLLKDYGYSQIYSKTKDSVTFVYTITNNESEPFTISEIGLVDYAYRNYGYTYYYSGILVERTILESPITIPAGGVGQVTYTIRMNGLE